MIQCHIAAEAEQPRLRALWQLCFEEEPESVAPLFARLYRPGRGLVAEADGAVQSMLLAIPMELVSENGKRLPAEYFYAVCTHPGARGKGYARTLLRWAEQRAQDRGCAATIMVPGEESLFGFYEGLGYQRAFPRQVTKLAAPAAAPAAEVKRLTMEEYNALREKLLAGSAYASYPAEYVAGQEELCRQSAGGLFSVTVDGEACLAAAEHWDKETVLCKELLAPGPLGKRAAAALCAHLGAETCEVRRPGEGSPFGVVKWLGDAKLEPCYFGLGLD